MQEQDLELLQGLGVEAAFIPTSLYATGMRRSGCLEIVGMGPLKVTVLATLSACQMSIAAGTPGDGRSDAGYVVGADAKRERGAHQTFIQVEDLQKPLCGQSRPHFFRGVATVQSLCLAYLLPCLPPCCPSLVSL